MKIAFATILSDGYMIFFDHLLKSILKFNRKFKYDFHVFYTTEDCRKLSKPNHEYIKKIYPNLKMHEVDFALYEKHHKWDPKYYSIESFKLRGYDKVIYIDTDMICRKPLKKFIESTKDIKRIAMIRESCRACFNAGLMVIDNSYLTDELYNILLKFDNKFWEKQGAFGHDQAIFNIHFGNKIETLDGKYNKFVGEGGDSDAVFYHYIHKPNAVPSRRRLSAEELKEWDQYDDPSNKEIIR